MSAPQRLRNAATLVAAAVLAGCAGATVQVEGDIPAPLVEPMPLKMGMYFEPALTEYVYEERITDHGDWRIELGPMQPKLFLQMGSAMFQRAVRVNAITPLAPDLDGVLAPTIADFQISIPAQTRSDAYEVWIKYLIRVYDKSGSLVAEWPLTAYGKASQKDYGALESTRGPAMQAATMRALRDAGAFLVMGFPRVPAVQAWLGAQQAPGGTP
jgi:hypothetical protein